MYTGILLLFTIARAQTCPGPNDEPIDCRGDCTSDSDCSKGSKCCKKDCALFGHVYKCTKTVTGQPLTDSYVCPTIPDFWKGDCSNSCKKGCKQPGKMCCPNGCGQSCMRGVPPTPLCLHLRESILSRRPLLGEVIPQCDEDGLFVMHQCESVSGYCWCVDPESGITLSQPVRFKVPKCNSLFHQIIAKIVLASAIPVCAVICFICIPIIFYYKRTWCKKKGQRDINYSIDQLRTDQDCGHRTYQNPNHEQQIEPSLALSVEEQRAQLDSTLREAPPPSYANRFQYKRVMGASEIMGKMQEPPPSYDTVEIAGRQEASTENNVMEANNSKS